MKKKNVLMMALSLALVAVIAIGGTLAMLTAQDGSLTNTFTFAGNIKVDLWENADGDENIGKGEDARSGADYGEIVVDTPYDKDVNVDVTSLSDAYVFIYIKSEGAGPEMTLIEENFDTANKLYPQEGKADGDYAIYCYKMTGSQTTAQVDVFDKVMLESENGFVEGADGQNVKNIVIDVFAIQAKDADGYMTASEAYEEAGLDITWSAATFAAEANFTA